MPGESPAGRAHRGRAMPRPVRANRFLASMAGVCLILLLGCSGGPQPASPILLDLEGRQVEALQASGSKAIVFLFARTDCPISNRYAPEVRRLFEKFSGDGVAFWLVYPDPDEPIAAIRKHVEEYGYRMGVLRDPRHELVRMTGARVTPEAAVFVAGISGQHLAYHGRIDDRYVDFGKTRSEPTAHDLEQVLEAVLAGQPVHAREMAAIGCFIPDLPNP